MSNFATKVKDAIRNFHLEQPGVGHGVGGQRGLGANEVYTSSSGNRWTENKPTATTQSTSASARGRVSTSTNNRGSTSS
jgi:hypothetical protein